MNIDSRVFTKQVIAEMYGESITAPCTAMYFEKVAAGKVLACEILSHPRGIAIAIGDDMKIRKYFYGDDAEQKAIQYLSQLGYLPALDWQLPSESIE